MTANERAVEAVLKNDGGTCHDFGKQHCFNDLTAKWEGRRCPACHDWARRIVEAAAPYIRAEEQERCAERLDDMDYFLVNAKAAERERLQAQIEAMADAAEKEANRHGGDAPWERTIGLIRAQGMREALTVLVPADSEGADRD